MLVRLNSSAFLGLYVLSAFCRESAVVGFQGQFFFEQAGRTQQDNKWRSSPCCGRTEGGKLFSVRIEDDKTAKADGTPQSKNNPTQGNSLNGSLPEVGDTSLPRVGSTIPTNLLHEKIARENSVAIDPTSYEADLLSQWAEHNQKGFDWEIEKMRRFFAGLRMREDGTWVRQPSFFDFLITRTKDSSLLKESRNSPTPKPVNLLDVATLFAINILSSMGFGSALGMAAVPDAIIDKYEGSFFSFIKGALGGDLQTLAGGPLFLLLAKYYTVHGPIFNLSFGPKSFLIVSDPVMARHILRSSVDAYDKGVLAEILEPIMGNGLIPADPETWKVRRRAIVPGFHKRWLNRMVGLFADCSDQLVNELEKSAQTQAVIDMEEKFCSVTLDIIGKAVFNYDFGSVNKESPIVKAVYRILREAEHRSSSFIPYWNLPYADKWMEGQREFRKDMAMMDDILANMINSAVSTRKEATIEELEARDNDDDPSLLRFLADMRGEDLSSKVLRDDLMTMLIAGHETTAAMLTWTLFELFSGDPGMVQDIQAEVCSVMQGKDRPDYDDIVAMPRLRLALIEALRLYPEPPVLIRRARVEDTLPTGGSGIGKNGGIKVLRGTDIFVSTWNLHRSPELWENPEKYDPTRWEREFQNKGIKDWNGYNPDKIMGLYPNEQTSDHAFLPFGAGKRKCVGDQFAMMEATITMVSICLKVKQIYVIFCLTYISNLSCPSTRVVIYRLWY
jgi:cytochrome P450